MDRPQLDPSIINPLVDRPEQPKIILTGQPICLGHTFKLDLLDCDNCGMSRVEAAIQELPLWRRVRLKQARDEQLKKELLLAEAASKPMDRPWLDRLTLKETT